MSSLTTSKATLLPGAKYLASCNTENLSDEKKGIEVDTLSCVSSTTIVDSSNHFDSLSEVKTIFNIVTKGRPVLHLPTPSKELSIPIYDATGQQSYSSIRPKRCSGSCILSHAKLGDLLSTTYHFGWTDPVLEYLSGLKEGQKIEVHNHVYTRTTEFVDSDGKVYQWKYENLKRADGTKVNTIALRNVDRAEVKSNNCQSGQVLARLIRDKETRTPGTSSCHAGNGGQLDIYEPDGMVIDECLIVATCILMLKKELDRRRALQIGMLSAAV